MRAVSEANDSAREFFTSWILEQVGDRDDVASKVVPDYVCLGKRTLQDNGSWLKSLTRDNVDLVSDEITEVTPEGVRTGGPAGEIDDHEVDVVIYVTGFRPNKHLWPMRVQGRDGIILSDQRGDDRWPISVSPCRTSPTCSVIAGPERTWLRVAV